MTCRGICVRYKAKHNFGSRRYASGQKRCSTCGIFISWIGRDCPCCGRQLKTTPTSRKDREKLREMKRK